MLEKIFPFLRWFPLTKDQFKADFIAGLTVAMLLIPQSMAYAELAGLDMRYGLYAAFIPVILGALFGCLNQLGTGPVAMTSILTAAVLIKYADPNNIEQYAQMAFLLALMVGIIRLILGLGRMAFVVNYLSHPVIQGFTIAGALIIGLSQVDKILGIQVEKDSGFCGYVSDIAQLIIRLTETHPFTFIIGLSSIVLIFLIKKVNKALPSLLIAVVSATVFSYFFGFEAKNGDVVGSIPAGLPSFSLPWNIETDNIFMLMLKMLPDALVITLIGFMEVLAVSKAIAMKTHQKLDFNQELIGQGVAAIGGSFFKSYPTSGSFSRSAMNLMAGAKTAMSSVFTTIFVVLVLLFFTPLLYHLPKATLAAGIIVSVIGLINIDPIVRAWKVSKLDGSIAVITFIATMLFAPSIVNGIIFGGCIALVIFIFKRLKSKKLTYELDEQEIYIIIKPSREVLFPEISQLEKRVLDKAASKSTKEVKIDMINITAMDASLEWSLFNLKNRLETMGIKLQLINLQNEVNLLD